jgi:type II secretory pathway pseudopilin PulG
MKRSRGGITLVEGLVVVGVLGVLMGLTLPAVQHVRASAARADCLNRLKQIGTGLHNFHSVHGRLPPLPTPKPYFSPDPNALLSWMAAILPEVGQAALYSVSEEACRQDRNPLNNPPHVGFATTVPSYVCPSDGRTTPLTDGFGRTVTLTSYVGVLGAHDAAAHRMRPAVLAGSPGIRLTDVTDGTAQTVMVGERPAPDSLQAGW